MIIIAIYFSLVDRGMRTCHCSFQTCPSLLSLESLHIREDGIAADQQERGSLKDPPSQLACYPSFYPWFLRRSHYLPEDTPAGLRLLPLTTHASVMLPHEDKKRPPRKRFPCTHCEKSFGKSSHLRDHIRTHTGDRPYLCKYCGKGFTQYSNLRTHTRIHTGEKPYKCKHCDKKFTQAVTLRSHTRTHTGNKPHHCKHCAKSFACFSGLKGHVRVHDEGQDNSQVIQSIKQEEDTTDGSKSL